MFYSLNLVFVECLYTCVFMCLFIHVCGCACMCVWRPEVAFIGRGPLLLKSRLKKKCSYVCVCLWVCAHKNAGSCRAQKRAVDLLQLELQAAESHQLWCQGPNSSPLQGQCVLSVAKLSFHHPALFLRQGISWAQGSLICLDWLASGLQGAPCLCLFSTGITSEPPHPAYYYVFVFF